MSGLLTNINALRATNALAINGRALSKAMQQLSTGKRINSAADDAAGLAMTETMTSQIRGLNMAVRNANDAISLLQTADGAMIEQTNMLQRMRELAVQAASDTVSSTQKGYLNTEYQQLLEEINNIGGNTTWNGIGILDASGGTSGSGTFVFQIGANSGQTISVTIADMSSGSASSSVASGISSAAAATSAISTLDSALDTIASQRATIGAAINQLTYAADNLTNISQNASESRSRVLDTDYGAASAALARSQIIQQASTAMLAQANQQPQMVLALLK